MIHTIEEITEAQQRLQHARKVWAEIRVPVRPYPGLLLPTWRIEQPDYLAHWTKAQCDIAARIESEIEEAHREALAGSTPRWIGMVSALISRGWWARDARKCAIRCFP